MTAKGGTTTLDSKIEAFINEEVGKCQITIFSRTTCRFNDNATGLLDSLNHSYNMVQLDELSENEDFIHEKLLAKTGQSTVPYIYINGQHLGGYEDLQNLYDWGIFEEILSGKLKIDVKFDYDMVVIGGGSAGLSAALGSSYYGESVCLINFVKPTPRGVSWGLGGTCINVGCVPKKLIHRAAVIGSDIKDAPFYGWTAPEEPDKHDWTKLVETVQNHITKVAWKIRKDLISKGVKYVHGMASLNDNHTVSVKGNDGSEFVVTTKNVIIAVGGRPRYLEFPGVDNCITSDDIFSMTEFPGRTLIIGGSYVALEIASFLNSLNADVTVMVRTEILNSIIFDRDMTESLEREMTREGVKFMHNCTIIKIDRNDIKCKVECLVDEATPYTDLYDTVVLAVGRIPSTEGLGLENVGIKLCSNSKIPVNDKDQTLVSNIFAIGDCANGRPELSSAALTAGRLLAKRLSTRECNCKMDYRCIPTSVFTWPEYACCGASEVAAVQLHGEAHVKSYISTATPLEQAVTEPAAKCYAKLVTVFDYNNIERLAGFHMVGPNASEIIQGFALALRLGASKKDLDSFVGIHPTCAEIFANLKAKEESTRQGC